MKVQILVGNRVINTQLVSLEAMASKPSAMDVKKLALKAALEDRAIRISDSLQATFLLFDVNGNPTEEP